MNCSTPLSYKKITSFWSPLWATWVMMALEGPFLAAIIARLPEPKINLAAYGVSFSIAIIVEAPVIMLMGASTALVKDCDSFLKLRRFTFILCGIVTATMIVLLTTPAFDFVALTLMQLPQPVADLTRVSLYILLPWPGAIGYRRFHQGLLIRSNQTRRVAYGTVLRLVAMSVTATVCYWGFKLHGAYVGAISLSAAVTLEAAATRWMARDAIRQIRHKTDSSSKPLNYKSIVHFYYPLALTSTIALAAHPLITFFLGQSRFALESLAVYPVVSSLNFLFRSVGLSYQEVVIALFGKRNEHYSRLKNYAVLISSLAVLALCIIAFTPLCSIWFEDISGLKPSLANFAVTPIRLLAIFPAFSVLLSFQRAILVKTSTTFPVTTATILEVIVTAICLYLGISIFDFIGVDAAAFALLTGRIFGCAYLILPCVKALKNRAVTR